MTGRLHRAHQGHHHQNGTSHKKTSALYLFMALAIAVISYIAGATAGLPGNSSMRGLGEGEAEKEASAHDAVKGHGEVGFEGGEEEESSGLEWEETLSLTDLRTIICVVLVLILLTVAFEVAKEMLEESVPEDFEVILEKFFGELTILGFLSMCTFLISKTGTIGKLSEHIFGEEEELLEYIE